MTKKASSAGGVTSPSPASSSASGADPAVLERRLHELEGRLLALRREISGKADPLPEEPFAALGLATADDHFLLPIDRITEVIHVPWPHPLPDAPPWIAGSFPFGDRPVPLVDLAARLHGEPTELRADLVVVVTAEPRRIGLLVERVSTVESVDPADLSPPSPGIPVASFVLGARPAAAGTTEYLLSLDRLVTADLVETLDLPDATETADDSGDEEGEENEEDEAAEEEA